MRLKSWFCYIGAACILSTFIGSVPQARADQPDSAEIIAPAPTAPETEPPPVALTPAPAPTCVRNYSSRVTYFCRTDATCQQYNTQFCGANFVRCRFTKAPNDPTSSIVGTCTRTPRQLTDGATKTPQ